MLKKLLVTLALLVGLSAPVLAADTSLPSSGAPVFLWDGTGYNLERTPIVYKTLNAVTVTSQTTVWTPASGKRFLWMGFCLAQGTATGAITVKDGATTVFIIPQNTLGLSQCFDFPGNGIFSAAANNVLSFTGASTETVTGTVFGTEE